MIRHRGSLTPSGCTALVSVLDLNTQCPIYDCLGFRRPIIRKIFEQKNCAQGIAQLPEGKIQLVFSRVRCQAPQNRRRLDLAGSDRDRDPQHLRQHGLDQIPIDPLREQEIEMLVANIGIGTEEVQALPIANTRLERNIEQMRQTKDCRALTQSVGVNRIGLNFGFVLQVGSTPLSRQTERVYR